MKNKIRKATLRVLSTVLAVFMLIGVYSVGVSAATDDGVIRNDETGIPDPVLYNYLISKYDTNADGVLQKEEADCITQIFYDRYYGATESLVYSLKGLNKCENLTQISFESNKLSNLNGIEGLQLTWIKVVDNELTDISSISGMAESLETLVVSYNSLGSLPNMKNFTNLKVNPWVSTKDTTNFSYNKLSLKELNEKLPSQLKEYFDFWMYDQDPDPEELNLVDEGTGIKVKGTMDPDATLKVEKVESTVEDAVATYDITLRKDGDVIQPSGTITISIPSEIKDCKLFWVKDDGTKVEVNAIYENGNYVFTTDHLSVYALVKEPEPTTTEPVETTTAEPVTTVPVPTTTEPVETTTAEPVTTVPVPTTTESVETTTAEPVTTVPVPTTTEPVETTTAEPATTVPVPTTTEPVETTTAEPATTVPVPTTTEPVETTTVEPVTTVPVPTTDPVTTVEPTTKSVATLDTPIDNNNSNSGNNSSSGSSTTNTNTSNGAVATGNMLGFDNNILIAIIIAATTALIAASKRRNSSK